jgi:hypothetical protein
MVKISFEAADRTDITVRASKISRWRTKDCFAIVERAAVLKGLQLVAIVGNTDGVASRNRWVET